MKFCKKCECDKHESEFSRDARAKDGLQHYCKPCHRASVKAARENHPDTRKKNRAKHYEKELAANRLYKERKKADLVESNRRYRLANAEKLKAAKSVWKHLRRAAVQRAGGRFTAADVATLFHRQNGKCPVCRVDLGSSYHVDHVQPIAAGGSNDKLNLQLLCPPCNLSKGARDPVAFMQSRGFLI